MANEEDLPALVQQDKEPNFEDIEAAYLRALEVADAAESLVEPMEQESAPLSAVATGFEGGSAPSGVAGALAASDREDGAGPSDRSPLISAPQVLEALLFVGGGPLPGRRLGELLGGETTPMQVEELVDALNQRYCEQGRPYEVRLVEGGYEMVLRPEFEPVRSRVYGQGPKEVKLSQDVLEVLAFVAYRQPVTQEQVVETGKKNAAAHLRQLLRRQLIELRRGEQETYHTTPRFLQIFGLADIDDLPLAVDFDFK